MCVCALPLRSGGEEPSSNSGGAPGDPARARARYNPANGQVSNADRPQEIWGRITLVKQGTKQEAVSLYCRRHGCAILKRCHEVPALPALIAWFEDGQQLPNDRSAAAQTEHKRQLLVAKNMRILHLLVCMVRGLRIAPASMRYGVYVALECVVHM